ncbi:MAG: glycosyltransferase [Candidatus Helarchaeota archaeon]
MKDQLHLLLTTINLLNNNNIEYWLDKGTLLGAIRENNFLNHDTIDIDIGLNQKDYWKVRKLVDIHNTLKYKRIWRTEIALYENDSVHIDLFFYTEKENKMCTSVFLGNKVMGGINIESEMQYVKNHIYPLKSINFLNHSVLIPNNPEQYLKNHYGDWKIKDVNWNHPKNQALNPNHRTIGILISTFLRDEKMMKCVQSILKTCDADKMFRKWIRIYIADQGYDEWSEKKKLFYKKLENDGHKIFKTPFNSGLAYNRNFLIKQSKEPYLMIIDDDFEFTEKTNLSKMIEILNHKEENGIVGGDIEFRSPYHADLIFEKIEENLCLYRIQRKSNKQSVKVYNLTNKNNEPIFYDYYYADIVLNFFLAKREILEEIPLDNTLKLCEHTDHFLRIKKSKKWKVCYCPDVTCKHLQGSNSSEYYNFRYHNNYVKLFRNKWNIKKVIRVKEKDIAQIDYIDIKHSNKIKIVQIARIPCANSGYELNNLINQYSTTYTSRYILGSEYSKNTSQIPYREFPYDLFWKTQKEECIQIIKDADIIHIHHDIWDELIPYLKGKKIVSTVYNLTQSLKYRNDTYNQKYIEKLKALGGITVADQPLQKKMFSDLTEDYVPLIKMLFNFQQKEKNSDIIRIGFSPTNRNEQGIGSKRYNSVLKIINNLKENGYKFEFDLIEGVPYEENIQRKANCDILIDDVDDNYEKAHNTTLEGALLDAVPLTNYNGKWFPAIKTDIITLNDTLIDLINNPLKIKQYRENVLNKWRNDVYTPNNLLCIYENIYHKLKPFIAIEKKPIIEIKNNDNIKSDFLLIDKIFKNANINYCLMKTSAMDSVKYGELKTEPNDLYIAVTNFSKANLLIQNLNLTLKIHLLSSYPKKTKLMGFYGSGRNVPFPLVQYLNSEFGFDWKNKK